MTSSASAASAADEVRDLDPFAIFDAEAARLDAHFASLDQAGWDRPSRCAGWSVRDVLGHLAGEELYNHACLDGDLGPLFETMKANGITGFNDFNEWCVRERRGLPVAEVLEEWRTKNGETRRRMRELGRDGTVQTSAGPYPAGLQTFHYDSEFATHADDVYAPVSAGEEADRMLWRVQVGMFALAESGADAQVEKTAEQIWVHTGGTEVQLSYEDFVQATVGRLDENKSVPAPVVSALRCLA